VREPGEHDEERKQGYQRQISEISGMDETIRIDADRDPLDDVEQTRVAPVLFDMIPAPFRRFG